MSGDVISSASGDTLARVDTLVADGHALDAIEVLRGVQRAHPDDALEIRLAQLRYQGFAQLDAHSRFETGRRRCPISMTVPAHPRDHTG